MVLDAPEKLSTIAPQGNRRTGRLKWSLGIAVLAHSAGGVSSRARFTSRTLTRPPTPSRIARATADFPVGWGVVTPYRLRLELFGQADGEGPHRLGLFFEGYRVGFAAHPFPTYT